MREFLLLGRNSLPKIRKNEKLVKQWQKNQMSMTPNIWTFRHAPQNNADKSRETVQWPYEFNWVVSKLNWVAFSGPKNCAIWSALACECSAQNDCSRPHAHILQTVLTHRDTHLFIEFSIQHFDFRLLSFNFPSIFMDWFNRLAQFIVGLILFLLIKIVAVTIFCRWIGANISWHSANQIDHFIDRIKFCST